MILYAQNGYHPVEVKLPARMRAKLRKAWRTCLECEAVLGDDIHMKVSGWTVTTRCACRPHPDPELAKYGWLIKYKF